MAIKYINLFQSKALKNLPKLGFFCFKNKKPSGNPAQVEQSDISKKRRVAIF
jgi:hypothetical protein